MSVDATLPIERRFADVRRTGRGIQTAGRRGDPGGSNLFKQGTAQWVRNYDP